MTEQTNSMWHGCEYGYEWLVSTTLSLGDLLCACPEIVTGRFVAVTAFDGGPLTLTPEELISGWKSQSGIAYSSQISNLEALPYDNCYDEWYIFDESNRIGRLAEQGTNIFEGSHTDDTVYQFVNYHLGLHIEEQESLGDLFWMQMRRLEPVAYLADCQSYVTMASNNKELFAAVRQAIGKLPPAR